MHSKNIKCGFCINILGLIQCVYFVCHLFIVYISTWQADPSFSIYRKRFQGYHLAEKPGKVSTFIEGQEMSAN